MSLPRCGYCTGEAIQGDADRVQKIRGEPSLSSCHARRAVSDGEPRVTATWPRPGDLQACSDPVWALLGFSLRGFGLKPRVRQARAAAEAHAVHTSVIPRHVVRSGDVARTPSPACEVVGESPFAAVRSTSGRGVVRRICKHTFVQLKAHISVNEPNKAATSTGGS